MSAVTRPNRCCSLLRHLLHVVAFAEGRLVAIDVVDADAVRRGRQRAGDRLQGARADRGDHRRHLAVLPAQRRGGMRHRHFVAAVEGAGHPLLLVDAQDLPEVGRAVAEDCEIFGTPCLSRPSTRPSDSVVSISFGTTPDASAASMLPAFAIARARIRIRVVRSVPFCLRPRRCSRHRGRRSPVSGFRSSTRCLRSRAETRPRSLFHSCQWRR